MFLSMKSELMKIRKVDSQFDLVIRSIIRLYTKESIIKEDIISLQSFQDYLIQLFENKKDLNPPHIFA